ncbi:hypothetical protein GYMLUDRAFT_242562 [Collybiopsis luxurians FD-317 M1]|uniref:Uncharacterized protein n=1 Tax=Collybiopsis luxurians FD-317 M1 TaxID=944289 RepID=A0A0D0CI76_9AGAR|nr:hypothetical protein GYMLUDRAFT_242562 [Collybiopsis luxurians FD-317 M1]
MARASLLALALAAIPGLVAAIEPTFPTIPLSTGSSTSGPASTSSPSTASATTSSTAPTGIPIFQFSSLPSYDIDTCSTDFIIQWFWVSNGQVPAKGMTLSVTNINVTQETSPAVTSSSPSHIIVPPLSDARRQFIPSGAPGSVLSSGTVSAAPGSATPLAGLIESLATDVDPTSQTFTWNVVNLPQAWYQILATATDGGDDAGGVGGIWTTFNATSSPFFIRNGTDTSCLSPVVTSTSTAIATTSTVGPSSPSSVSSLSSTSHVNRGAIAGGVVGGIAAIAALLGICLFLRQGRRRKGANGFDDTDAGSSSKPNIGKWGALGSFDSSNGPRPGSKSKDVDFDPVTMLNTSANSRPQKSGGFGLGDMGLAALGLAKSQENPPSTHSKRNRRQTKHNSSESAGAMMASSFSSSSFSPSSSAHGHFDPFRAEESPYEKGVPMRDLSPTSSPVKEENPHYRPYISSIDTLDSGTPGVEAIPIGYEISPFVTPPPSEPASRHNSRSYSKTSLPNANSPTQTFAAFGAGESSSSTNVQSNRARSKSQNSSPTSTRPPMRAPDVPESPRNEPMIMSHQKRASSPDAIVYTLTGSNRDQVQAGSKGPAKRTARKPVPSYTPEDSPVDTPASPVYTYSTSANTPTSRRRPPPVPATTTSESASSSSSSFQKFPQPSVRPLEHKDSAHSLASLRKMEGDLSGYSAVLGNEAGGKQMHLLIPDMPLSQN